MIYFCFIHSPRKEPTECAYNNKGRFKQTWQLIGQPPVCHIQIGWATVFTADEPVKGLWRTFVFQ